MSETKHQHRDCTAILGFVESGDPDRSAVAKIAPREKRCLLLFLYAFNLEAARITWKAPDPATAAIRFQWWHDIVDTAGSGNDIPRHHVAEGLDQLMDQCRLPTASFHRLLDAYQSERSVPDGHDERQRFAQYIDSTAGEVMWLAAQILDRPLACEETVRDLAWGCGVASYLRAVATLKARGRLYFLTDMATQHWAVTTAAARIDRARSHRSELPASIFPALLTGWRADSTLRRARVNIARVDSGGLDESEFVRRVRLAICGLTGRW